MVHDLIGGRINEGPTALGGPTARHATPVLGQPLPARDNIPEAVRFVRLQDDLGVSYPWSQPKDACPAESMRRRIFYRPQDLIRPGELGKDR